MPPQPTQTSRRKIHKQVDAVTQFIKAKLDENLSKGLKDATHKDNGKNQGWPDPCQNRKDHADYTKPEVFAC